MYNIFADDSLNSHFVSKLYPPSQDSAQESQVDHSENSRPLLEYLKSISDNPDVQEVIQLLQNIRNNQDHPEMQRTFLEHNHAIAHEVKNHGNDILHLLIDDYLRLNKTKESELTDSDKRGLAIHVGTILIGTLRGYQEAMERIRSKGNPSGIVIKGRFDIKRLSSAVSEAPSVPQLSKPTPLLPRDNLTQPNSRITIPAAPAPPSTPAGKRMTVPYLPAMNTIVDPLKPTTTPDSKAEPFVFKDEVKNISPGSSIDMAYAMENSTIEVADGAELKLFMAGNNVTIRLQGKNAAFRLEKLGRNCKSLRILGPNNEDWMDAPNVELSENARLALKKLNC